MTKEEKRKLWFHTIVFIVGTFLIGSITAFLGRRGNEVGAIVGSLTLALFFIGYSSFMLRWFRKKGWVDKNKSSLWNFFWLDRYSLVGRWTDIYFLGILFLIIIIIYLFVALINSC